jgi:hypothetical protein
MTQHVHPHKVKITVVVNGTPAVIDATPEAPLRTLIPRVLDETHNAGQPPENWELRDASGTLLDLSQKIEAFKFPTDVRLFLNLKAGVGGAV